MGTSYRAELDGEVAELIRLRKIVLLLIAMMLVLQGCDDRVDLEDISLLLMMGIDLDKDNNLVFYSSNPVFSKEAKEKNEQSKVHAITVRGARNEFDARVSALISSGKIQNVLIGKRILEHEGWLKLLDLYFRDSKANILAKVIAVDGSVEDIIYFKPANKRRLPLHVATLIDTARKRNLITATTLHNLHNQAYEKGITPYVPQLRKDRDIVAMGTALLNKKGKFETLLSLPETQLLLLLQDEVKGSLSCTIQLPEESKEDLFSAGAVTFYVLHFKRKVHVTYSQDQFHFDVELDLPIRLTEKLFAFDVEKDEGELEEMINRQLNKRMKELIDKLQKKQLDPIGLGTFARAYQYSAWEKVDNRWGEAFSKAEVNVRVKTTIKDMGEVK
ncbi:Ger(x)C family spore germination protein [Paenibacillus planticolens]|uniref:Ger(X)C family spore germination protein n=1 Tax=Paenibacillus planticolens TaxID=2654976 RepID=A0ABX1ZS23_9BACL|nr:Ger(x)C family spore germination protein [Paenibacillus planticolens]NOV02859.1 Ger(x)C family spore germination protein [Paenibacillus planticolens]